MFDLVYEYISYHVYIVCMRVISGSLGISRHEKGVTIRIQFLQHLHPWILVFFSPSLVPIPRGMRGRITSAPLFEMTGFGTPKSSLRGSCSTMIREEYLNIVKFQKENINTRRSWGKHMLLASQFWNVFFPSHEQQKTHQLVV